MKAGDALVTVGGRPIRALADVKIALWDRLPGERVSVRVRRDRKLFGQEDRAFEVELR
jgi:S1-C subfamily serine protease